MRMILMFLFEVIILPISALGLGLMWLGTLVTLVGLLTMLFLPIALAVTIWGSGLMAAAFGAALFFTKSKISEWIATG